MCNITKLNAKSESREIRRYFKTVLLLLRSGEKFPVNLDDVWPLVYGSRDDAVHFLTEVGLFYNGEDYKVFRRNAENLSGRHTSNRYMLSVSCMEYVIVRKSRRLLASFRYVFRKYIDISVLSEDEIIVKAMLIQQSRLEGSSRFLELNMKKIEAFRMQLEIEKEAIMERKREFLDEKNADLERAIEGFIASEHFTTLHGKLYLKDIYKNFIEYCKENDREPKFDERKAVSRKLSSLGYVKKDGNMGVLFIL